jgi:hypothetical protein
MKRECQPLSSDIQYEYRNEGSRREEMADDMQTPFLK